MEPSQNTASNNDQPVAYDTQGRPLYLHPADAPPAPARHSPSPSLAKSSRYSQMNQGPRATDEPDELARRRAISNRRFPRVSLHETEYIITKVQRHPVGTFSIWIGEIVAMIIIITTWAVLMMDPSSATGFLDTSRAKLDFTIVVLLLQAILLLIGWAGSIVYKGNRFIVTNERVIQYIRMGLLSKRRKTISLASVEDVRYSQSGVLQTMLGYGSIRLSTVGNETTYPFTIVQNPRQQTRIINSVVAAFQNGHQVPDSALEYLYGEQAVRS